MTDPDHTTARKVAGFIIAIGWMLPAAPALAQTAADRLANTCSADFARYCASRVPVPNVNDFGPGGLARRCLDEHIQQLSRRCWDELTAQPR